MGGRPIQSSSRCDFDASQSWRREKSVISVANKYLKPAYYHMAVFEFRRLVHFIINDRESYRQ
jgi:hypothetical protein